MRFLIHAFLVLPLFVFAVGPMAAADPAALDPNQPYQAKKSSPIVYDVDYRVVVTPPSHTKQLRVWLPLPPTDAGQQVAKSELSSFPMEVKPQVAAEPVFGNRFAYFQFDRPEGAQVIRHTFKIKVWELHWELDPRKVQPVKKWPASFEPFLRAEQQAVVVNDSLRKLADDIVPQRQGEAQDLTTIIAWVNNRMMYDHGAASLQASSEHALKGFCGHCSDYHGLCAAVGRALGYPTRVTYGINPFPKNSPSHCKLEAYVPPYGWVSFDVSETQRLLGRIQKEPKLDAATKEKLTQAARDRLARGFRDHTWFVQTRGSDYDLAPKAGRKVSVVRTIYAEADGVPLPDPDPANPAKKEFAWMTLHRFTPDRPVSYPFADWKSLEPR